MHTRIGCMSCILYMYIYIILYGRKGAAAARSIINFNEMPNDRGSRTHNVVFNVIFLFRSLWRPTVFAGGENAALTIFRRDENHRRVLVF